MCRQPGIHAIGIGLQMGLHLGRKRGKARLRKPVKPKRADVLIGSHHAAARHLREAALSRAPLHLHLEQAFACVDIAESTGGIVSVGGEDMGDAPAIAVNASLS